MSWFAHCLQYPAEHQGVAPVFVGAEAKERVFWSWFGEKVIGKGMFLRGKWEAIQKQTELWRKFLIVCDHNNHLPLDGETVFKPKIVMKSLKEVENHGHWVFLADSRKPFEDSKQKDAFVLFQYNPNQFEQRLMEYLSDDLASCFAQFLLKRDLRDVKLTISTSSPVVSDVITKKETKPEIKAGIMKPPLFQYDLLDYVNANDGFKRDFPKGEAMASVFHSKGNAWLSQRESKGVKSFGKISTMLISSGLFEKEIRKDGTYYIKKNHKD